MTQSWKDKNRELAILWQSRMEQWAASGLNQSEYCRQNNLSRDQFTYWKIKFTKECLPVELVQVAPGVAEARMPGLKLNMGHSLQIEIPDGFSQATLERVLMALKVLP